MVQSSLLLISYSAVSFSMVRPLCQQPPVHHQPGFPGWSEADCCPYPCKVSEPASKAVRHLCRARTSSPNAWLQGPTVSCSSYEGPLPPKVFTCSSLKEREQQPAASRLDQARALTLTAGPCLVGACHSPLGFLHT